MRPEVMAVRRRDSKGTWLEIYRGGVQVACDRRCVPIEESVSQSLSAAQLRTLRKHGVLVDA